MNDLPRDLVSVPTGNGFVVCEHSPLRDERLARMWIAAVVGIVGAAVVAPALMGWL